MAGGGGLPKAEGSQQDFEEVGSMWASEKGWLLKPPAPTSTFPIVPLAFVSVIYS